MFSRSFMKSFNLNKYRSPVDISTNPNAIYHFMPPRDYYWMRGITGLAVIFTMFLAYRDPSVFYELLFHPHYPGRTVDNISRSVPKEIRQPNEEVLENAKKLHQVKEFVADFKH